VPVGGLETPQRFRGHALIEVLRPAKSTWRQVGDKDSATESEKDQSVTGGPSWIRTRGDRKKDK